MMRILEAKTLILNEEWWSVMEMTCSLLCVLVDKMKETDHAHFLTAKMRDMWLKGQVHIESDEFQSHYRLPEIKDLYLKQWAKGYHPVFSAAAIMNPAYHHKFGYTELLGDAGVQKDLHKMMGRFFNTVTEKQAAVAQLSQYTRWHGAFAKPIDDDETVDMWLSSGIKKLASPATWWEDLVPKTMETKELREFAIYVHSTGTSIGDVERLHSLFTNLLGSKRQRMAHKSTSKQIKYVTNAHFLKQKSDEENHDWSSDSAASAGEEEAAPARTTA